jgi:hypothetical protein
MLGRVKPSLLTRRVGGVLMALHEAVNLAMKVSDSLALRLRGMSGEHRLDGHVPQHVQDVVPAESKVQHVPHVVRPQALLGLGAGLFLTKTANLRGGSFFDDVQELKGNRVGLTERPRGLHFARRRFGMNPRQAGGQLRFAHAFQHGGKGLHEELKIISKKLKSELAERRGGRGWHGGLSSKQEPGRVQTASRKKRFLAY